MYHAYFSVEHFMRAHQRELLATAQQARLARSASRGSARRFSAEHRSVRRPTLVVRALAVVGRALVIVGRRLEDRAAAAARTTAAGMCEEQHSAVGC